MRDGPGRDALARGDVLDLAYGETPDAFFLAVAREEPRGPYPRGFSASNPIGPRSVSTAGSRRDCSPEDGALEPTRETAP